MLRLRILTLTCKAETVCKEAYVTVEYLSKYANVENAQILEFTQEYAVSGDSSQFRNLCTLKSVLCRLSVDEKCM